MTRCSIRKKLFYAIFFTALSSFSFPATALPAFDPSYPPIKHSNAFKQYKHRPKTELSKIVYLVDRFSESKVTVNYDGYFYDAQFSSKIARWFLARRYKGQSAQEWILLWCNKAFPSGNLIWVQDEKENVKLAREVLKDELLALDDAIKNDVNPVVAPPSAEMPLPTVR